MRDNDSLTRGNMQTLMDFIRQENRRLDNSIHDLDKKIDTVKADLEKKIDRVDKKVDTLDKKVDRVDKKVDVLTDAVIEGFDNTERILSDWEGKPVTLISKQTKDKLQNPA